MLSIAVMPKDPTEILQFLTEHKIAAELWNAVAGMAKDDSVTMPFDIHTIKSNMILHFPWPKPKPQVGMQEYAAFVVDVDPNLAHLAVLDAEDEMSLCELPTKKISRGGVPMVTYNHLTRFRP